MSKSVQLPTCVPVYSTYNFQTVTGVVAAQNPQIYNWYLNNSMILQCGRRFLRGFTSPEVYVCQTDFPSLPHIDKYWCNIRSVNGIIHSVIKNMLDQGFYVAFNGVDDFYVKGKSWYQEIHMNHDGLICGYDEEDETYTIMAYDQRWICCAFKTPQHCFEQGVSSMIQQGIYGDFVAIQAKQDTVELDVPLIKTKLKEYLNSNLDIFPPNQNDTAFGTVVHDYINMYLNQLYNGFTPYEKKDRRIFRLIWEHKKCMLDRINAVEEELHLGKEIGKGYENIVQDSESIRMMYAKYNLKRNDEILLQIKEKLTHIKQEEQLLLENLIQKIESGEK